MKQFVCQKCGAPIEHKDSAGNWVCDYCHSSFRADVDEEGYEFLYRPIEKKSISANKISQKAATIHISRIAVREIKVDDEIEVEVNRDAYNLSKDDSIRAAEAYLGHGEYEKAAEVIDRYLAQDNNCAEMLFYSVLCEKRFTLKTKSDGHRVFDGKLTPFSSKDKTALERVMENASPKFAKKVMDICFSADFSDDESCERILDVCAPYVLNDSVYPPDVQQNVFRGLFETVISKGFIKSFEYLLRTLDRYAVDDYISYNLRFAERLAKERPLEAKTYLFNVLSVESGNTAALRKLVEIDAVCDEVSLKDKISDLEQHLGYSSEPDKEVLFVFELIMRQSELTEIKRQYVQKLIGYHSVAPRGLEKELIRFANKLLELKLFNEAKEYFYLVLSFNKKCRAAFLGLCLAAIEAENIDCVWSKDSLLKDCVEFNKCIALSNEKEQAELIEVSQEQEKRIARDKEDKKRRARKRTGFIAVITACVIAIGAAVIGIIIGASSCAAKKKLEQEEYLRLHSADNVVITVTNKESLYSGDVMLYIDIENRGTIGISGIYGEMRAYKGDDSAPFITWNDSKFITSYNSEMAAGGVVHWELTCKYNNGTAMTDFYYSDLDDIRITYTVSTIRYSDGETVEYTENNKKTIKPYDPQAVAKKKEAQYQNAMSLMQQKKYDEAYRAFDALKDYKDSAQKKDEAYSLAYSADNIVIAVTSKENISSSEVKLYYDISNKSVVGIDEMSGELRVYNGDTANSIFTRTVTLSDIKIGDTNQNVLTLKYSWYDGAVDKLYDADFDEIAITFILSEITYVDGETVENTQNTEKIIKPYDPQDAERKKEAKYQSALSLMQHGKYKEATGLFKELADYRDSKHKIDEIAEIAMSEAQAYADIGEYGLAYSTMNEIGYTVDAWGYASQEQWQKATESGLTEIVVKEGTKSIGSGTFRGCYGLKRISLPSSLEIIGESAFQNCYGLTSITIPSSVYSIGSNAFSGCYRLVEVYNLTDLKITKRSDMFGKVAYYAKDLFSSASDKSNITVDSNGLIFYDSETETVLIDYEGTIEDITLPVLSFGKQYSVYDYAFYRNDTVHNVVIPDCVIDIGDYAFYFCRNLSSVSIGSEVVTIGRYAFAQTAIASISIGNGVLSIGEYAFNSCGNLSSVTLGAKLQDIGKNAFSYCKTLQRITIPASVTSIQVYAFYNTGLVYVKFDNTEGWRYGLSPTYSSGDISSSSLTDPANAAKLLTTTYYSEYWTRS